jgi:hypothetical protein
MKMNVLRLNKSVVMETNYGDLNYCNTNKIGLIRKSLKNYGYVIIYTSFYKTIKDKRTSKPYKTTTVRVVEFNKLGMRSKGENGKPDTNRYTIKIQNSSNNTTFKNIEKVA